MEFLEGVKKKEIFAIRELEERKPFGEKVSLQGAVHSIRNMGEAVAGGDREGERQMGTERRGFRDGPRSA